jgi:hypothetical protein
MISMSRTGDVASSSKVPDRFSSAKSRMVIMGMKKRPTTLTLESRGRTICSLTFMGKLDPRSCISMPSMTKKPSAFQKKKPKIKPNIVSRR